MSSKLAVQKPVGFVPGGSSAPTVIRGESIATYRWRLP